MPQHFLGIVTLFLSFLIQGTNAAFGAADVSLTISKGGPFVAGAISAFDYTLTNFGPSDAPIVQLTGSLSTELGKAENITCTATGNSQCNIVPILPAFPIVSSLFISQSDIKAGTSVRYRVQVLSDPFLNKTVNIVGILRVFGNVTDLDVSNDAAELLLRPNRHANFVVTKNTVPEIPLGDAFTYTITVRNTGPSFVFGTVVDPLPSYLTEPSWSCRGFSGAVCGSFPSNARTLIDSTFYLPLGGTLEYYLVTVLDGFFTVVNRVNVSSPDGSFASATSIVPSYIPSTTSTPTPTPTRTSSSSNDPDFVCHDPESCDDAWNEDIEKTTCTDLEDSACQDKIIECIQEKDGCGSDYSYVVLIGKEEDQTYPVATQGGASVGTVRLKKGVLKKGYTITIAYHPRMTNKDLDKGLGGGDCIARSSLIWTGGVEVVVRDQGGDVKHDFNKNDIEITLPAVIEGLSEEEQKDLCLGSTDERSSAWDCNADETQVKKGGKILTVKRRFDHLSTFSVLLGTTSGCSLALWTASVVLIVVVPLFFASVAFVLYRFYCGRALIYGYRGREISMITKKAQQQQQPQVKDISGIQNGA